MRTDRARIFRTELIDGNCRAKICFWKQPTRIKQFLTVFEKKRNLWKETKSWKETNYKLVETNQYTLEFIDEKSAWILYSVHIPSSSALRKSPCTCEYITANVLITPPNFTEECHPMHIRKRSRIRTPNHILTDSKERCPHWKHLKMIRTTRPARGVKCNKFIYFEWCGSKTSRLNAAPEWCL